MARVEETLDPLTASSELFSDDTNEDVTAFKGAVPKSFYANSDILSRRLNVLFTNKWDPPIFAHDIIKWTYTKY